MTRTQNCRPITPKELRVVVVTPCFHVLDGVSLTIRNIRDEVIAQGGKILIATSDAGRESLKDDPYFKDIVFCKCVPLPYDSTDMYSIPLMMDKKTQKLFTDFKPDVFHVTSPDNLSYSVCQYARSKKHPVIATWHSNVPDYLDHVGVVHKTLLKPIIRFTFRVVYSYPLITYVPQLSLVRRLRSQHFENPATKNELRVWGRGVDTELFTPAKRTEAFRKNLGIKHEQVVILWVSRCVKEKRPDVFIDVMKRMQQKYPRKVVGLLVGRGEVYSEMEQLPNVKGLGWQDREALSEIYACSDILLFPSAVETFGNVTLEGMSSGICAVADSSCSSHLVENGVTGFTCSQQPINGVKCAHQYFNACEKLILNPELRRKMSYSSRGVVVEKWAIKPMMSRMVQNYVEAANIPRNKLPEMQYTWEHQVVYGVMTLIDTMGVALAKAVGWLVFQAKDADKVMLIMVFGFLALLLSWGVWT